MERIDWEMAKLAIKTLSAVEGKRYDDMDEYVLGRLTDSGHIEIIYTRGQTTPQLTDQGTLLLGYLLMEEAFSISKGHIGRGMIKTETPE